MDPTLSTAQKRTAVPEGDALRQAVGALPVPIWLSAADGSVTFCNRCLLTMVGVDCDDMVDDQWLNVVHVDDRDRAIEAWRAAIKRGEPFQIEHRVRVADGSYHWLLAQAEPQLDGHRITGWIGHCTDIEERKRAEQSVQHSEQQLRAMLEYLPVGVWLLDQYGHVIYGNPAAKRMWGGNRPAGTSSLVKYNPKRLDTGEPLGENDWASVRALQSGEPKLNQAIQITTTDGHTRIINNSAVPICNELGESVGVVVLNEDITERKQSEEELRRSSEQLRLITGTLEQRVAERTAVAQRQTEQLRALANELTQAEQRERRRLAHMLHDHLQQLLVAARLRIAGVREHASRREQRTAMRRVDELLDQSIESARTLTTELSPPILHEGGLCPALQWLVRWMHDKHALEVHLDAPDPLDELDQDVCAFLFESVRELLFNVVKHAGVMEATVRVRRSDGRIELSVEDRGAGFELRDSESNSDEGFGLFSIRERLEGLGGQVVVRSTPGEGTCITMLTPMTVTAAKKPITDPPADRPSNALVPEIPSRMSFDARQIRVMLADDHKILREGLAGVLRHQPDIELIAEAEDGVEAVELARALRPDVLIMDISMPRINGIEATRRLKTDCPETMVIGLSMHEDEEIAQQMKTAGAWRFLSKGGPSNDLIEAIRACRCRCDDNS